jgi:ParB/RepB/Spo0J family partition protein
MSRKSTVNPKEPHRTVEDLVTPFGWTVDVPELTDTEHRKLFDFLKAAVHVDSELEIDTMLTIPDAFWQCVVFPKRLLPMFANTTDARSLAMAACETCEDLLRWRKAVEAKDLGTRIAYFLHDNFDGTTTAAGSVYSDTQTRAIWFGRKAGKAPAFSDERTTAAFDLLFGVTQCGPSPTPEPAKPKAAKVVSRATTKPEADATELRTVPLSHLQPSKENHRKVFDKKELQELADSIKTHGVLQPLLIRPLNDGSNFFVIIAGERRYRAALLAGLKEVPTQIVTREGLSESLAMLHENIMRVDLNPIERAEAIKRMMTDHGLSQAEVGKVVGVQQGQISNELRLLNLPESLRKLVADGTLAPTLIRMILPVVEFPKVAASISTSIEKAIKAGTVIEKRFLQDVMRNAVVEHSRSTTYDNGWSDWQAPDAKKRHFSKLSDENAKALDIREFEFLNTWEGQKRTFNLELFNELNKTPLANRREKHRQKKESRQSSAPTKDKSKSLFNSEWQVRGTIGRSLTALLADAIEQSKDKAKVRVICLALMAMSGGEGIAEEMVDETRFNAEGLAGKLLKKLDVTPAAQDALIRSTMLKELRKGFHLDAEESIEFGKYLSVDLASVWKPDDELMQHLTDNGKQLVAETAGEIPEFLREFFGLPAQKPARTKKGKAA